MTRLEKREHTLALHTLHRGISWPARYFRNTYYPSWTDS